MKAVVWSDQHLEQGGHLGRPDAELGNSRLRDAQNGLRAIGRAARDADALVFGGDLARQPRPGPLAYRVFIDALRTAGAVGPEFIGLVGNHDALSHGTTPIDVVARGLGGIAVSQPTVVKVGELQVGCLPWTPAARMFERAPHDPAELYRQMSSRLVDVVAGMSADLNPHAPSMLVLHWTLDGDHVPDVVRGREAMIDVDALERVSRFDCHLAGHWHRSGQLTDRTWMIGPPMRSSFGEAGVTPGYITVDWADDGRRRHPKIRHHELPDRRLLTIDLSPMAEEDPVTQVIEGDLDVVDAIVRLVADVTPERARQVEHDAPRLLAVLEEHGAFQILGPQLRIQRPERERRSALAADVDPHEALGEYLEREGVPEDLHELVHSEARRLFDS